MLSCPLISLKIIFNDSQQNFIFLETKGKELKKENYRVTIFNTIQELLYSTDIKLLLN